MRCTVERARFTRCAIWPRLKPAVSSSSARRIAAARAITCTWLLSLTSCLPVRRASRRLSGDLAAALHRGTRSAQNAVQKDAPSRSPPVKPAHGRSDMVQQDRARRAFPVVPASIDYWRPTMTERRAHGRQTTSIARLTDFGDDAPRGDGSAPASRSAVLSVAGPGVQGERDAAIASRRARRGQRFSGRARSRSGRTAIPASRISPCRTREAAARRTGALRARSEILRRDDQRPHQRRSISTIRALRSVLGARRRARRDRLHSSGRSGRALAGAGAAMTALRARRPGNGASRPARMRLRLVFGGLFDRFPRAKIDARPSGRDAALSALALRQPRQSLRRRAQEAAVGLHQAEFARDDVGHVRSAEPLRCALDALGRDKVMFAADYPFESAEEAGHFMDTVALDESERADVAYNNAARVLGI